MNILERTQKLSSIFSLENSTKIDDKLIEIIPFDFTQKKGNKEIVQLQYTNTPTDFCNCLDNNIKENIKFKYKVFNPKGRVNSKKAILLLHGLNERSWDKYLTWAEDLSTNLGEPVILFPIAFHMNRTPKSWFNPRQIMPWASKRKSESSKPQYSSFLNLALSSRLSTNPERLYISGRETIYNICQLLAEIKQGKHLLFNPDCKIDIFSYSIGSFLAEILLIANPYNLVSNSKLFVFCGGSIFEKMDGVAKDIMDQEAFTTVKYFYLNKFNSYKPGKIENAFKCMLSINKHKIIRENFYTNASNRIKIIGLKQDTIMPIIGAKDAVGKANESLIVEELDFPFKYSHQIPFPTNNEINPQLVYEQFRIIFNKAEDFLC